MNEFTSFGLATAVAASDQITVSPIAGGNKRIAFSDFQNALTLTAAVSALQAQVTASQTAFGVGCDIFAKATVAVAAGAVVPATVAGVDHILPYIFTNSVMSASGDIISNVLSNSMGSNTTWQALMTVASNQVGLFKRST